MQKFVPSSCFIAAVTLMLAACEKPHEKAENGDDGAPRNVTVRHKHAKPTRADDSFSPEKAANGTAAGTAADRAIPAAFQGRWALVQGDCGPDASLAKGLMVIDGKQLRFYESVGKPAVVSNPTPSRMEGRFSFSGEGMDWSKDMGITLEGDGDKLVRTEEDPKVSYRYTRCPA